MLAVLDLAGGWPPVIESVPIKPDIVAQAVTELDARRDLDGTPLADARERVSRAIATRQGQPHFRAALLTA
jgi:hypothetical protein